MSNHTCPPCPHSTSFRKPNQVEVNNAIDQTNKEVSTRFDFKGSDARVEHKDKVLTLHADDDFKLSQVTDILTASSPSAASTSGRSSTATSRRCPATR